MEQHKGRFDFDRHTPVSLMRTRLEEARDIGGIYLIARVVECIRHRGVHETLRRSEERRLIEAIRQARFGETLPLKQWLPRGYQIARLLATALSVIPEFKPAVTKSDTALMQRALEQFEREADAWDKDQIPSLMFSAKRLGVILKKSKPSKTKKKVKKSKAGIH